MEDTKEGKEEEEGEEEEEEEVLELEFVCVGIGYVIG